MACNTTKWCRPACRPRAFRFPCSPPPIRKAPLAVTVNPAGGMPIQRPALKTKEPNVYKVDYPVRPGETRFDLNYTVPTTSPMIFSDKLLHADAASNLVVPNGV